MFAADRQARAEEAPPPYQAEEMGELGPPDGAPPAIHVVSLNLEQALVDQPLSPGPFVSVPRDNRQVPVLRVDQSDPLRPAPAAASSGRLKHYDFFGAFTAETNKRREVLNKWLWNRLWFILSLFGMAAGIYLSLHLVPLIISALLVCGFAPWLAWALGFMAGLGLVWGTTAITVPALLPTSRLFLLRARMKQGWEKTSFLTIFDHCALLAGAGFGIYLCVIFTPVLMNSLLLLGIPSWMALGAGVVASLVLIDSTIHLFSLWSVLRTTCNEYASFERINARSGLSLPWVLGWLAGLGAGIYCSILVAPLVVSSVLGLGLASPYAWFIAAAVLLTLMTGLARLVCFGMVSLVGLMKYSKLSTEYSLQKAGDIEQKNWLNFERTAILQSLAKTACPPLALVINDNTAPPLPSSVRLEG